ncbi:MAG: TonB-dependent receptor [Bacteroidales bacterium]|nr:TonB-dependent receptor [Bacteroidales bacterium]MDD4673511.1 TonB-dependent receptor [Bacteroidales bacterium]
MLKTFFTFTLPLLILTNVFAVDPAESMAPGAIKGFVYDSLRRQPLEYATVSIVRASDNTLITGTITDETGFFKINGVEPGKYFVDVTFIGYYSKRIGNVEVKPQLRSFDMGQVLLVSSNKDIDEVIVVADRPTMKYQIDKKVINVSQHHTSSSGSAVEVLENIPSITVSIEGDVSLRGSGSFTLLIDGKPSIMDANDALNQIPASQIENIEIITNPSARFDPDGVAGIINIIMKTNRLQGMSGVVNASGGTHNRYGGDFIINYRKEKFNFLVGADYNRRGMLGESINRNETYRNDTTFYRYSLGEFDRGGYSWGFRLGADYNINAKNSLSVAYRFGDRSRGGSSDLVYQEWNSPTPNDVREYSSTEDSKRGGFFHHVTMDYRKEFDTKDHNILAQVSLGSNKFSEESENLLFDAKDLIYDGQKSIGESPGNRLTFKLDYTLPFGKSSKFETGYQGNLRSSDESNTMSIYDIEEKLFMVSDSFSKEVNYQTNIHAVYAMLGGERGDFGYQLGLRTEYTDRRIDLVGETTDFNLNRWDYYPTAHFSYNLPAEQEIMASFTRRLQRLRGWYLEPFYTWSDAYNIRIGNPDLIPEYIESYEVSYQKRFTKNVISVDLYYRVTNNKIERLRSIYEDNDNIFLTTFANVGQSFSLGTEIMVGFDPARWWHFDLMGNIYDYKQEGEFSGRSYSAESFNWNARMNNNFKLARFTRLQFTGMYNSPTVTAQGTSEGFFVTSLALKQDFLKNALSLTLSVRDVFGTMGHKSTVQDDGFYTYREWNPSTPIFTLTASFRINNFRDRRRGSNGSDPMDDMGGDEEVGF